MNHFAEAKKFLDLLEEKRLTQLKLQGLRTQIKAMKEQNPILGNIEGILRKANKESVPLMPSQPTEDAKKKKRKKSSQAGLGPSTVSVPIIGTLTSLNKNWTQDGGVP